MTTDDPTTDDPTTDVLLADHGPVAHYLDQLAKTVHGPRRHKADLLAEARTGLEDAVAHHRRRGAAADEAERLAVAEFGPVADVAPGYQRELGLAQSHRTAVCLLLVLLVQPVVWDVVLPAASAASRAALPPVGITAVVDRVVELSGGAAMLLALGAVVLTGPAARHVTVWRRASAITGTIALAACALLAVLGVVLLVLGASSTGGIVPFEAATFAVAVVLPLGALGVAGRRCLRHS